MSLFPRHADPDRVPGGVEIKFDTTKGPPTDEQRARYKAAYKRYRLACGELWASRQEWLPDHPSLPVGPWWGENNKIQHELIVEAEAELDAEAAP